MEDEMEFAEALELGRNAFWIAISTAAPILLIGLAVGLIIAFFQAVTQMQEQTLTFVPKILAMVVAASIFIPWISERMVAFTRSMFQELPW
jgi:flagellar biosynthetic protein FliQ